MPVGLPGRGQRGPVTWGSGQGIPPSLPPTPSLRIRAFLPLSSQPDQGPGRWWLLSKCSLNRDGVGSGRDDCGLGLEHLPPAQPSAERPERGKELTRAPFAATLPVLRQPQTHVQPCDGAGPECLLPVTSKGTSGRIHRQDSGALDSGQGTAGQCVSRRIPHVVRLEPRLCPEPQTRLRFCTCHLENVVDAESEGVWPFTVPLSTRPESLGLRPRCCERAARPFQRPSGVPRRGGGTLCPSVTRHRTPGLLPAWAARSPRAGSRERLVPLGRVPGSAAPGPAFARLALRCRAVCRVAVRWFVSVHSLKGTLLQKRGHGAQGGPAVRGAPRPGLSSP